MPNELGSIWTFFKYLPGQKTGGYVYWTGGTIGINTAYNTISVPHAIGLMHLTIWRPVEGASGKYQLMDQMKLNITDSGLNENITIQVSEKLQSVRQNLSSLPLLIFSLLLSHLPPFLPFFPLLHSFSSSFPHPFLPPFLTSFLPSYLLPSFLSFDLIAFFPLLVHSFYTSRDVQAVN